MSRREEPPTAQKLANDIARSIGRRGWPAEAKAVITRSPFRDTIRWTVIIPRRGIAVINDEGRIVAASSNRPPLPASSFNHTTPEADAEQTLRSLPLP